MEFVGKIQNRNPFNGTFELTGRCNLKCNMCLLRVDNEYIERENLRELTADEWINMAEQARDKGTIGLLLTGGEIMLRPDFCEIYEGIYKLGFLLTIYTNATLVNDKIMNLLEKYPPHKIGVTMYGASNETYQRMCGCDDGYDRFVNGVARLAKLPSLLDFRTTIVKDNLADLKAMQDFVKKNYGEDKILHISRMIVDKVRGAVTCPKEVRLTPMQSVELIHSDIVKLYNQIKNKEREPLPKNVEKFNTKMEVSFEEGSYLFKNCSAGIDQYIITWDGSMYACELLDKGCTDALNDGFAKAWDELPYVYPATQRIEKCETCKYSGLCETCPAVRLAETGDWFGIPKYACQEARNIYDILVELNITK